jgi:hypothetical protein
VIPASIDPFFFEISWPGEEEEEEAEREFGFEELEIEGLKYKTLSIKKLKLKRVGETDEDDEHAGGKAGAISRLLSRIIDSTEDEEDEDE